MVAGIDAFLIRPSSKLKRKESINIQFSQLPVGVDIRNKPETASPLKL